MNLTEHQLHQLNNSTLSHDERALLLCRLAKQLEVSGNYKEAQDIMSELWPQFGKRPILDGLAPEMAAEVLWRVGVLTGCIGSDKQIEGAQEIAKNLISESITIFEQLQQKEKINSALTDLAVCYWRVGSHDDARVILLDALARIPRKNKYRRAVALDTVLEVKQFSPTRGQRVSHS